MVHSNPKKKTNEAMLFQGNLTLIFQNKKCSYELTRRQAMEKQANRTHRRI